jgi:hypothetical protein
VFEILLIDGNFLSSNVKIIKSRVQDRICPLTHVALKLFGFLPVAKSFFVIKILSLSTET